MKSNKSLIKLIVLIMVLFLLSCEILSGKAANVAEITAPDNLMVVTRSSSQIDLSWSDNSDNEEGFIIENSTDGVTFSIIDSVLAGITEYSATNLEAGTLYYFRINAFNSGGNSNYSSVQSSSTMNLFLIIDHRAISLFDQIPQNYLEEVKKCLLILPGESHGTAYGYGLELVESDDTAYNSETNWNGAAESYTESHLRWNRSYLYGSSWNGSCGEEDFWTNEAARSDTAAGLQTIERDYTGKIYFGLGWCWDFTWLNSPTAIKDPVYNCGWAGSSVDGPDGNLPWGLDDEDYSITGNSVNLQTYINAVEYYNTQAPGITTIYTTGPVDGNANNENGYQRHLKHEAIRNHVKTNGGILFDYADILSWDYVNEESIPNSWDSNSWNGANILLATGGTGYNGGNGGSHISEEACRLLGKAIWVMVAKDLGWDGK